MSHSTRLSLSAIQQQKHVQSSLALLGVGIGHLKTHPRALIGAALIAGVAPLFGFTAIALGLVGNVTALFKLSAVFTILWARLFLGEGNLRQRLLGAAVMIVGGLLVSV